ncbi:ATPase family protein associated with various cellular activities (AAA) [Ruminiclostridium sufflavum DSM 19573]|uniref:ATPase family protein associated with various cellular activities (AAA) n=1 Tax=Ruminiclostridium sufflavum DSM 19573 TaxID=1121337 RepID=A0A318XGR6_9FIRM|nr:ATP-binding protein [Ruminiclostridium sufflavum]PYG85720.1 ATPase family protein associated with various cellular activities (AAA) [Ruminiclostridium sufflavum DSM 19573]
MKADLFKRLFKAIFSEDIVSLKKIANIIIHEERELGHGKLADSLEHISVTEKPRFSTQGDKPANGNGLGISSLPSSKRDNSQLVSFVSREMLKHHMVLPQDVENRLLSIEKEYAARERLGKYNLTPKRKILLHGSPGCGKTLSAERIAWNLGLPLLKVRFDALLSSYFGESASNLRAVFDYCKKEPVVLLLDECDFIAKSRVSTQDVGEVPRIVNMLLTLLDEYNAPGLVIATTNLRIQLDEALFRRFDDVIEIPMPQVEEREKLLKMTLSAIAIDKSVNLHNIAEKMDGYSYANVVLTAERAAKYSILAGNKNVRFADFEQAITEGLKF